MTKTGTKDSTFPTLMGKKTKADAGKVWLIISMHCSLVSCAGFRVYVLRVWQKYFWGKLLWLWFFHDAQDNLNAIGTNGLLRHHIYWNWV